MGFVSKVIGDKKQWKEYKSRKKQLPANYQKAVDALEIHILTFCPETGDALMRALNDLIDLFEQSAEEKKSIREIVGENPSDFAEAFTSNYTNDSWRDRELRKLSEALDTASKM
jgi:DNA-binding ferritin-like protein (Dps family)